MYRIDGFSRLLGRIIFSAFEHSVNGCAAESGIISDRFDQNSVNWLVFLIVDAFSCETKSEEHGKLFLNYATVARKF